jgi:hypothetical protein
VTAVPVVDISTRGTEKLIRLGAAIRQAGDKDLKRELTKAMRRAGRPLLRSARQGALQILPYHGGLNERVAASRFSSTVSTIGSGAGLRISAVGRYQLSGLDDGIDRHPVFGNRANWVTQAIVPGWFSKPLTLDAPKQKVEVDKAVDDVAAKLEAAGG